MAVEIVQRNDARDDRGERRRNARIGDIRNVRTPARFNAVNLGVECGAQIAGLGAFTAVVGDGGITVNERSPIPVTTGNSLTIAAGVQSFFRAAREMEIDPAESTAVVYGMPAAAVERNAVCESLPLPEIAPRIRVLTARVGAASEAISSIDRRARPPILC